MLDRIFEFIGKQLSGGEDSPPRTPSKTSSNLPAPPTTEPKPEPDALSKTYDSMRNLLANSQPSLQSVSKGLFEVGETVYINYPTLRDSRFPYAPSISPSADDLAELRRYLAHTERGRIESVRARRSYEHEFEPDDLVYEVSLLSGVLAGTSITMGESSLVRESIASDSPSTAQSGLSGALIIETLEKEFGNDNILWGLFLDYLTFNQKIDFIQARAESRPRGFVDYVNRCHPTDSDLRKRARTFEARWDELVLYGLDGYLGSEAYLAKCSRETFENAISEYLNSLDLSDNEYVNRFIDTVRGYSYHVTLKTPYAFVQIVLAQPNLPDPESILTEYLRHFEAAQRLTQKEVDAIFEPLLKTYATSILGIPYAPRRLLIFTQLNLPRRPL